MPTPLLTVTRTLAGFTLPSIFSIASFDTTPPKLVPPDPSGMAPTNISPSAPSNALSRYANRRLQPAW